MKKSFVLYTDQGEIIDSLTDSQAGKLIKAIFDFQKGKNPELPTALRSVFISFKQTLVRDNEKWENIVERNRKNIKKRYEQPQKATKSTSGRTGIPNKLDSVNDNDNESVKKDSKTRQTLSSYKENRETNDLRDTTAGSTTNDPFKNISGGAGAVMDVFSELSKLTMKGGRNVK